MDFTSFHQFSDLLLTGVFAVLAYFLRRAVKRLNEQEHTRVKANLSFHYVTKQEPEYQTMYDAAMRKNGGAD